MPEEIAVSIAAELIQARRSANFWSADHPRVLPIRELKVRATTRYRSVSLASLLGALLLANSSVKMR